jgi:hypothetical protein
MYLCMQLYNRFLCSKQFYAVNCFRNLSIQCICVYRVQSWSRAGNRIASMLKHARDCKSFLKCTYEATHETRLFSLLNIKLRERSKNYGVNVRYVVKAFFPDPSLPECLPLDRPPFISFEYYHT